MPLENALNAREEQIKNILLMQIESHKHSTEKKIWKEDGIIKSTQLYGSRYHRPLDPDMSDIAIDFYMALYKGTILKNKKTLLKDDGSINDPEFAGDTIFTVKSLRYVYSRKKTIDEKDLDKRFKETHAKIHCLANFWVIPMRHGRRSKKLNYYDSPDLYLDKLGKDYDHYRKTFPDFFRKETLKDLTEKLLFKESKDRITQITERDLEIFRAYDEAIEKRAIQIAQEKTDELWELFSTYHLLDT